MRTRQLVGVVVVAATVLSPPVSGEVDPAKAEEYFAEATRLCEEESSELWGRSLCGPMVFADAATKTIATNRPIPEDARPRVLGYANTALDWGGERWSTFVWRMVPSDDDAARGRLLIHELFHRIQPELGLFVASLPGECNHLDTPRGRYWLQLEFRALSAALASTGAEREGAIGDALSFRAARRSEFPEAAAREQPSEINEGLAQYTATVVVASSRLESQVVAIDELRRATEKESFVRTFAYSTGAAYGLLLDEYLPGWRRSLDSGDDLSELMRGGLDMEPSRDAEKLAAGYGGAVLWSDEEERERGRLVRVRDLEKRFVEGPVLRIPRGRGASFITTGLTPIPDRGAVYPSYRVEGPWGSLEAAQVLVSPDGQSLTLPGPFEVIGAVVSGQDWTLRLKAGWQLVPGLRDGDSQLVAETP